MALARKVETPLDEDKDYKKLNRELESPSDCADAAVAFADHAREHTAPERAHEVPSLLDGIAEFQRLP